MSNHYKRIAVLIVKHRFGVASTKEQFELHNWVSQSIAGKLLTEAYTSDSHFSKSIQLLKKNRRKRFHLFQDVLKLIFPVLVLVLGRLHVLNRPHDNFEVLIDSPQPDWASMARQREVDLSSPSPADYKATLLLANDSTICLDDRLGKGKIANEDHANIELMEKGHILYAPFGSELQNQLFYNQFSTPKGGHYRITLPDGTLVHLNSASTIRYGASFGNETRDVDLEGEAYFTVKPRYNDRHERIPFIVHVNCSMNRRPSVIAGGKTEFIVLATEFNLTSYPDDSICHMTPCNGSVVVKEESVTKPGEWSSSRTLLAGDEYSRFRNGEPGIINKADVSAAVAWEKGFFCFKKRPIREIMRQLARWYNAEVVYKDVMPGNFSLTASRNEPIRSLLDRLANETGAHFSVEEDKIVISR